MLPDRDTLHIWLSSRAKTDDAFFTSQVGTGSWSQCFGGALRSSSDISWTVTGVRSDKRGTSRGAIFGSGAPAVAAPIPSTLALKCALKSDADSVGGIGDGGGFSSVFTCDHRTRESCLLSLIVCVQYDVNCRSRTDRKYANCCRQAASDSGVRRRR